MMVPGAWALAESIGPEVPEVPELPDDAMAPNVVNYTKNLVQ